MASSFREAAARGRAQKDYNYKPKFNSDGTFYRDENSEIARAVNRAYAPAGPETRGWDIGASNKRLAQEDAARQEALCQAGVASGQVGDRPVSQEETPQYPVYPTGNEHDPVPAYNKEAVPSGSSEGLSDAEQFAIGAPIAAGMGAWGSHLWNNMKNGADAGRYYFEGPKQLNSGYIPRLEAGRSAYAPVVRGARDMAEYVAPTAGMGGLATIAAPVAATVGLGYMNRDARRDALERQLAEEDEYYNQYNDF